MSEDRGAPILILVAGYPPAYKGGGPVRTIEAMVKGRSKPRRVEIVTSAYDYGESTPLPGIAVGAWVHEPEADVYRGDDRSVRGRVAMFRTMRTSSARVLYVNSLFSPAFSLLPLALVRLRVLKFDRIYLAPRGELDPGAVALKGRKKRLALGAYKLLGLDKGVTFHASSPVERDSIGKVFPGAAVVVKENEALIEPVEGIPKRPAPRTILYLGRISQKKNLHVLIEALCYADLPTGTRLVVAGSGDTEYIARCREAASKLKMPIEFVGAVDREHVFALFRSADVACFPTAGENFGHVIPEAMSQACPVLISAVTPWTDYVAAGGGMIVPGVGDATSWASALETFFDKTDEQWVEAARGALCAYSKWEHSRVRHTFLDVV